MGVQGTLNPEATDTPCGPVVIFEDDLREAVAAHGPGPWNAQEVLRLPVSHTRVFLTGTVVTFHETPAEFRMAARQLFSQFWKAEGCGRFNRLGRFAACGMADVRLRDDLIRQPAMVVTRRSYTADAARAEDLLLVAEIVVAGRRPQEAVMEPGLYEAAGVRFYLSVMQTPAGWCAWLWQLTGEGVYTLAGSAEAGSRLPLPDPFGFALDLGKLDEE